MSQCLYLVFSTPSQLVSDDEYNRWYDDTHLTEILTVPGFGAARRYRLHTIKGDWTPSGHRYLSVYELDGTPEDALREMRAAGAAGRIYTPDWLSEVAIASFRCYPHQNAAGVRLADHLYLVLSRPPEGLDDSDFVRWYGEHADENTQVPGFHANWRFRLESSAGREPASPATHLAAYEVDQDLASLQANLRAAAVVNRAGWPAWFDPSPWTSFDAVAIGGLRSK